MNVVKVVLFPLAVLYGFITGIRNRLFDWGILSSHSYEHPLIGIGNLSTGGTGKTPHVEYLIKLLKDNYKVATLSRGYKRKSKGFVIANNNSSVDDIGDEPLQMYLNHPDADVAVCENRNKGIQSLLRLRPHNRVILLDDVFQHRYVKPGLNILLTDYHNIFTRNYLIPTGNLRESRKNASRADILIVTKTPHVFSPLDRNMILNEVRKYNIQHVYFSYIKYGCWVPLNKIAAEQKKHKANTIFLLTGIANPVPLTEHLKRQSIDIKTMEFSDHHQFSARDLRNVADIYHATFSGSKVIITTEKDSMRLRDPGLQRVLENIPVYYIPIEVEFHPADKKEFDELVLDFVKNYYPKKRSKPKRSRSGSK
jgi:tetraacyldisaccharide 4'-kinase